MPDVANLSNTAVAAQVEEIIEGTIYKTPALGERVQVVIPDVSDQHTGEVFWVAQLTASGFIFPHAGDKAVIGRVGGIERVLLSWETSGDVDVPLAVGLLKGFVAHGEDEEADRPSGYPSVEWNGTVAPLNKIDNDTWVNPGYEP